MTLRNLISAVVGVFHHDAAADASEQRRGPNPETDAMLRKLNGSSRFRMASIEEQTAKAMAQHETLV